MPDLPSPRKPPRRFWLYAPYVALAALIAGWSVAWVVISQAATARFDQAAAGLRAQGWTVSWVRRVIGGYPFRLNIRLEDPHIAEPSGWGLAAPALEAEAYAYAPGHWVMVAPQGVTLARPFGGGATIGGAGLRASVTGLDGQATPQVAVEGWKLTLTPQPGAQPLGIDTADRLAFYLRPLAGDQAEFQLQLTAASPSPGGLLARISADRPLSLVWDETVSHASSLGGRDWPSAVRRWSASGGAVSLSHGEVDAGEVTLTARSGPTTVDPTGHLAGNLVLDLSHAGGASRRLDDGLAGLSLARTDLNLAGGKVRLGPFVIGKAPRIY